MLKDKRILMLELLAQYKYLCRSQFSQLGLQASRNHFTNLMKSLTEKSVSYVGQKKFSYHPKYGKVEDLYFLKPKGKKYLINEHNRDPKEIHLPLGSNIFWNDYHHRKETINLRIEVERQAEEKGLTIEFYDMYFTGRTLPGKKGRECSTALKTGEGTIKADSIFLLTDNQGRKQFFCLEYHNGHEVKRIVEQLKRYVQAMALGTPSTKYGLDIGNYVWNVFANETVMNSVKERVEHDVYFANMKEYFLYSLSRGG